MSDPYLIQWNGGQAHIEATGERTGISARRASWAALSMRVREGLRAGPDGSGLANGRRMSAAPGPALPAIATAGAGLNGRV